MNHVYLCGHTGSENRGCDAIVRATAGILRQLGQEDIKVMTFAPGRDKELKLDEAAELMAYPQKPAPVRAASLFMRKVMKDGVWGQRWLYRDLLKQAGDDAVLLNIGGDTYCYGTPYISYALNEMAESRGLPVIFWGCSVDERLLEDRWMQRDINRYTHIVTRETLSYNIIRACLKDESKVWLACDPAFALMPEEAELPAGFLPENTVGINISPLVCKDADDPEDILYQNVCCLMDYILENSDMSICLIPHVYNIARNTEDIRVLRTVYARYADNERVSLVERELNCSQLKYIISRCRFFVGARTHSMIAAYSSAVPALALSYSIKSLGLARDILGSEETYALSWKALSEPEQLRCLCPGPLGTGRMDPLAVSGSDAGISGKNRNGIKRDFGTALGA